LLNNVLLLITGWEKTFFSGRAVSSQFCREMVLMLRPLMGPDAWGGQRIYLLLLRICMYC